MNALGDILIIVALFIGNGIFAMSEMAMVSARKSRLQQRAKEGSPGAVTALDVLEDPTAFLSTVQIGITLIGIWAGAIGGAALRDELAVPIGQIPALAPYATTIALGVVVVGSTYLSLIIGELVPKRLALASPEAISALVARPMQMLARLAAPIVKLLSLSTDAVVALIPGTQERDQAVTEDELINMLRENAGVGELEHMESKLVERALYLDDILVDQLMTPYPEVEWLDINDDMATLQEKLSTSHARYPIIDGSPDKILGIVRAKKLLQHALETLGNPEAFDIRNSIEQTQFLPVSSTPIDALTFFRNHAVHMALLVDEYGNIRGVITPMDILQGVVGDMTSHLEESDPDIVERKDGSLLIAGTLPLNVLIDQLGLTIDLDGRSYRTLGGLIMAELARIPHTGDTLEWEGHMLEVVDMDGRRVDRVLVKKNDEGEGEKDVFEG